MERFVILSGCSGGGKSTLLAELGARGHAIVPEPGRRIVQEELQRDGSALPWVDALAFTRRTIATAVADRLSAEGKAGWVFFDRGLIDAAANLEHLTGEPVLAPLRKGHGFFSRVFLTPPWPEIYLSDDERRHSFGEAVAEYVRLLEVYPHLGFEISILPRTGVKERADFILGELPDRLETPQPRL